MGRKNYYILLAVIAVLGLTSGCLKEPEEPPSALKNSGYMGCSGATVADDSVSVRVDVVMPDKATEVQILRNSTVVGSVFPSDAAMTFIDSNLPALGEVYRYACKAIVSNEGVLGYNQPTVQTNAIESPTFLGLDSVTIQNKVEAKLQWKVPDIKGPKAAKYKIYANLETGGHVDLTATPIATVTAPATSYTIATGNLGDNLNYAFAVVACTANDLCSGGTVYKNATTLDNGAPLTTGASAWKGLAGGLQFTVPWNHKMGEIKKRYVYVNKTTNTTGGLDWANQYQQLKVIDTTTSLYNPSLWTNFIDIKIVDTRIVEKSTQHFIIRDIDAQGNQAQLYYLKIDNTGDLSAPVFAGYSAVAVNPGDEDTQVKLTFTAIDREGSSDPGQATGAAYYKVYYTSEPYVSVSTPNPNDPCKFGTAYNQQFSASGYPPGAGSTLIIPNLTPRTLYRFCLKAADTAGNESADQAASDLLTVATWDKTPPQFDGIQNLSGVSVSEEYKLKAEYNPATDLHSNVSYYKIKTWVTTADYASSSRKATVNRYVADGWIDYAYLTNNTDLKYDDNVLVRVVVDACDDAHTIPGMSVDNCTSFAESTAMSISPPDIVPPQLFLGIDATWFGASGALPSASSVANGQVIVKFRKPSLFDSHVTADEIAQYQDYAGFKVYSLDVSNNTTLLKNCPCAVPGSCNSTTDLQCVVDGLNPDKLIKFYARAYDAAGNVTKYVDAATKNGSQRVFDGVAPMFAAGVAVSWNNAQARAELTWNAATDNQDSASVITYQVFRKKTSWTLGEKANPDSVSGALRGTSTTTSYYDTDKISDASGDKLASGGNFYYLVCAKDAQNNRTCDSIDKNLYLADVVAPIISTITTDKTNDSLITYKKWYIKFYMEENESTFARMTVTVRSKYSAGAASVATSSDPLDSKGSDLSNIVFTSTDAGVNKKGYIQINNLVGTAGLAGYMNYFIELADENGNRTSFTLSVQFDNSLTFTSIANTSGSISGGSLAVIKGGGFSSSVNNNTATSTTVSIGGNPCTSVNILTTDILTCIVPSSSSGGLAVVTITNPDGTSQSSFNPSTSYTYTDGITYPFAGCDKAGYRSNTSSIPQDSGSYLICNKEQLILMGDDAYRTLGATFKLGDNLDLSVGIPFSPIGNYSKPFSGIFDGDGHLLSSLSYSSSTSSPNGVGLFGNVTSVFQFKNTVLINFNIVNTANNSSGVFIGSVLGKTDGETLVKISDVSVFNSIISTSEISDPVYSSSGSGVGGVFGYIGQGNTSTSGSTFSNISVSGTTVTAKLGGSYSTPIWSINSNQYDGTGLVGGSMLYNSPSTTFESFTDITINNSILNCRASCGGVLGRAFKADFSNIQGSSVKINTYSAINYYSSYLGANGVGLVAGKIGYFNGTNGSWGVSLAKDISVNGEIKVTNTLSSAALADSDAYIGGAFGLIIPYTDVLIKNVTTSYTLDVAASSGNSSHMPPLSFVGGVIGLSVVYNRTDASGTAEFNNIVTSSSNIQCDSACGGIVGGIILPGDSTDKSSYLKTYKFVKNKVDSIFNFSGGATSVAANSTTGGHGGIIGRVASKGVANKILITMDQVAVRGSFNDLDSADFGGGAIGVYDNYAGHMWTSVYYPVDYETVSISNSFFATNLKLSASAGANSGGIFGYYAMTYFDSGVWNYRILSTKTKVSNTYIKNITKYNVSSTKASTTFMGASGISAVAASTFCDVSKNSNNFVDIDSTMNTNYYITSTSCSGFTSKSTSEMKDSTANIYQSAGWDFTSIWKWPTAGNNDGYPVLQWMGE